MPPAANYTRTVADGEILKVMPEESRLPKEQIVRYYFKVEIKGQTVHLTQVADEFGKKDFFDLRDKAPGDEYGKRRDFDLRIGKPVVISYNVPGGGPVWEFRLQSIQ